MNSLRISTSDKSILDDLKAEEINGLSVYREVFACDSPDWIPPVETVITIAISATSGVALNMLSSWLYDRFIKKNPDVATIENQSVVGNPEQITVVINNYIQINQQHFHNDGEK